MSSVPIVETGLVRSSHESVTIKGFTYLVIAALVSLVAVFNYVFTHRVSDNYTVAGWVTRVPLPVIFVSLGAGFLLLTALIYADHPIDRAITICGIIVCFALVMWTLMDTPAEFDGIAPPDINTNWFLVDHYTTHIALLCTASVAWTYFIFLGGSARLDRLNFFSIASMCIIGTIYALSYSSMAISMSIVDMVQNGNYYGHDLMAYVLFGAVLFGCAVFVLFAIETMVKGATGYHRDDFVEVYNAAPKTVHDAVSSTYSAGFWCIIIGVAVPMACAWALRDNVLSASSERRNENWREIGNLFFLGAITIPVVTILIKNHSREGGVALWGVRTMESVIVSVVVMLSMAMFQSWTSDRVNFLVMALLALNMGLDMVHRGKSGAALNYTTLFFVANEVSAMLVDDPIEQPLATAGLVAILMTLDAYFRDQSGASMAPPVFFISFAASYGAVQYINGPNTTGMEGEHKKAMELAFSFWVFNVFMNTTFEHMEHIPGYVTSIVFPFLTGVVGAYGYDWVMRSSEVADKIDGYQEEARKREEELEEDLSHLTPIL